MPSPPPPFPSPGVRSESNRNICILLNEAYEVLMDPEQRTAYNAELDVALAVSAARRDRST